MTARSLRFPMSLCKSLQSKFKSEKPYVWTREDVFERLGYGKVEVGKRSDSLLVVRLEKPLEDDEAHVFLGIRWVAREERKCKPS